MRLEDEVLALAADQHGRVATWQLRAIGLTDKEIHRLRRSSGWTSLSRRVLARTGSPEGVLPTLMAGVLDASPGAAVAGRSAAVLWGVPGFRATPVELVRPRGISRRRPELGVVHEVVDLGPSQLKVVQGITVVSPARLVCELAGTHPHRAESALDRLWSDRLLDGRTFHLTVGDLAASGRAGSTLMRALDAARGPSYVPPASALERRFMQISDQPMRRQVESGGDAWCGRVDFRHPVLPLIVEVQSERYHASLVDRRADAVRRARLEAAGFVIVEVWDTEVWHQPHEVNERIRTATQPLRRRAA